MSLSWNTCPLLRQNLLTSDIVRILIVHCMIPHINHCLTFKLPSIGICLHGFLQPLVGEGLPLALPLLDHLGTLLISHHTNVRTINSTGKSQIWPSRFFGERNVELVFRIINYPIKNSVIVVSCTTMSPQTFRSGVFFWLECSSVVSCTVSPQTFRSGLFFGLSVAGSSVVSRTMSPQTFRSGVFFWLECGCVVSHTMSPQTLSPVCRILSCFFAQTLTDSVVLVTFGDLSLSMSATSLNVVSARVSKTTRHVMSAFSNICRHIGN